MLLKLRTGTIRDVTIAVKRGTSQEPVLVQDHWNQDWIVTRDVVTVTNWDIPRGIAQNWGHIQDRHQARHSHNLIKEVRLLVTEEERRQMMKRGQVTRPASRGKDKPK